MTTHQMALWSWIKCTYKKTAFLFAKFGVSALGQPTVEVILFLLPTFRSSGLRTTFLVLAKSKRKCNLITALRLYRLLTDDQA